MNVKKAFTVQIKKRYATCVRQTHSLLRDVVQSRTVYATLVGRELTVTAVDAWLANIKTASGLFRVPHVQLADIQAQ